MNLLNLQVKIERLKLQIEPSTMLAFSLRLGRVLTSINYRISDVLSSGPFMDIHESLILTCQESHLKSVSRVHVVQYQACLVINKVGNRQQKQLLGMVFIPLGNTQRQVNYYRIQQCSSTDPYVELSFSISNLQLQCCQINQSSLSRSSLAEIKQFHKFLSFGVCVKQNSDFTQNFQDFKRMNVESKQNKNELKVSNINKIGYNKKQRSNTQNDNQEDPSYKILLKRLEGQLAREKEKIKILTGLFLIEEQKNKQLQMMLDVVLDEIRNRKEKKSQESVEQITSVLMCDQENEDSEEGQKIDYNVLLQERNEYYALCQQLSTKIRLQGEQNKQLVKKVQSLQNQLSIRIGQISELKIQNTDLKAEMFDLYDQSSPMDMQLKQENDRLKQQLGESQRKMKECMKAIQEYKDSTWKVQQQLLLKEGQINGLRQEMQLTRSGYSGLRKSTRDSTDNSSQKSLCLTMENMKVLSGILTNSKQERMQILERMRLMRDSSVYKSEEIEERVFNIVCGLKDRFNRLFMEFKSKDIKFVQVLEMRSSVMRIMNANVF